MATPIFLPEGIMEGGYDLCVPLPGKGGRVPEEWRNAAMATPILLPEGSMEEVYDLCILFVVSGGVPRE